jgi:mono/diheme cytochrome c family protein
MSRFLFSVARRSKNLSALVLIGACTAGGPMAGPLPHLPGDGADGGITSDLPCDVATFIADNCVQCHGAVPSGGAADSLVTHDDFTAPTGAAVAGTMAELAVLRMRDAANPMPPNGPLSEADIEAFAAWVESGAPVGECGGIVDPYNTPVMCSSGKMYKGEEGYTMRPGEACVSCHRREDEGPIFNIAGTVYPSAHEPDDCKGWPGVGAKVEITDANGATYSLDMNSSGNFTLRNGAFVAPYTARVTYQGRTREMVTPQTSGDCNTCHTTAGAEDAPGRIMLP